ncbi:hypothetical protein [Kitasatospora sp. NBC_01266]|uniref:hypothetical protein n=1 Tax=Kitasatospora sp. NBC_01266 TaxID=2903572 RepID=UPI002E2FC2C7|nr:hypothetical protein [Kitasatospora sp. NBC_01266]
MAQSPNAESPSAESGGCALGCLTVVVGAVVGVVADGESERVISEAWGYCTNQDWYPARMEAPDDWRFGLVLYVFILLYAACLPVGFAVAWRLLRGRGRWVRTAVGVLAGVLLLGALFGADLAGNVAPKDGYYLPQRCPLGHPPWWPSLLPISDSGSVPPIDFNHVG